MANQFTKKNQSVDKVFTVIEYMAEKRMPLKLLEISAGIDFPASTVSRLLTSLIERGYVYQDRETARYSLTLKFCTIGDSVKSSISLTEIIHPYLLELSNKSKETAYFAQEKDMSLVYMDAVGGTNIHNANIQRIGHIAPLHATGIGKLLLLNYDSSRLNSLIEKKGLPAFTEKTCSSYDQLRKELESIKAAGCAIDDQECDIGIRCVAVPLYDYTGNIVGGISISGPAERIHPERYDELLDMLKPAASRISTRLGYGYQK